VYALDTEDDSKGHPFLWIFFNGIEYFVYREKQKAIEFIDSLSKESIFCVNLEYDLINTFGVEKIIEETEFSYSGNQMIKAKYKGVNFYNTLVIWFMGVKQMGEFIGIEKLPFEPESIDYCKRDSEITWNFVNTMLLLYDKLNIKFKSTIGSTALHHYLTWYKTVDVEKIEDDVLYEYKKYYYGGRVECKKLGEIFGNISCYDVNSLYPFCMKNYFPLPDSMKVVNFLPENCMYLVDAIVESNMETPVLPKKINGKLCFPNGTFQVFSNNVEIEYFKKQGGKILSINKVMMFESTCRPFDSYVFDMYNLRIKSETEFEKYIYKKLLNTLYGKFAQGNENFKVVPMGEYVQHKEKFTDNVFPILENNYVITYEIGKFPRNTNYIWSLFITAYGRIELHKLMMKAKNTGLEILYYDTDSIIVLGNEKLDTGNNLGELKKEYTTDFLYLKNVKEYYFRDDTGEYVFKVKGIPKKDKKILEQYFRNEEVFFDKPQKLRESLRSVSHKGEANIWYQHSKKSKGVYDKGVVKKDVVHPFILNDFS
jgi:hypothetical protein